MYAKFAVFVVFVVVLDSSFATAQSDPSHFPTDLPPGPERISEGIARQKAGRLFYEAWAAKFRAQREISRREIGTIRGADRAHREEELAKHLEQLRTMRTAKRLEQQEETR